MSQHATVLGSGPSNDLPVMDIARAFARIGALSFGGGSASLVLMRRELVDCRGWLTAGQYNRGWTLSKLSPGINQIAQVILYGRHLGGWRGALAAVAGFVLPSVVATVLISFLLVAAIGNRLTQDALHVVIPVTGGMTLVTTFQMWGPRLPSPSLSSWVRVLLEGLIVVVCGLLVGSLHVAVPLVMLGALVFGAVVVW